MLREEGAVQDSSLLKNPHKPPQLSYFPWQQLWVEQGPIFVSDAYTPTPQVDQGWIFKENILPLIIESHKSIK